MPTFLIVEMSCKISQIGMKTMLKMIGVALIRMVKKYWFAKYDSPVYMNRHSKEKKPACESLMFWKKFKIICTMYGCSMSNC